jgi:diguanylate cyclase (GGDEF)-like protein
MFREVHVDDIEVHAGAPQIARLLSIWRCFATAQELPPFAEFDPERLPGFAPNLAVVEPVGDGDYCYIYYGRDIAAESGVHMLGSRVSQWKSEIGLFFCGAYNRAVTERRPVYTVHRANHAARVHLWERVVLPTATAEGGIRLVVFNKPREYKEDVLKAVLDSSPDGILALRYVRNDEGEVVDALVLTLNERMAAILGHQRAPLLGSPLLELAPDLSQTEAWRRCLEAASTGKTQQFEACRGAECFNFRIVPVTDGVTVSATDITAFKSSHRQLANQHAELAHANELLRRQARELRAAEEAAREAHQRAEQAAQDAETARGRLLAAFDMVPEGLVLFDKEDRYVLWNRSYAEMYAESQESIAVGSHFLDVLRYGLAKGQYPEAKGREDAWLAERVARQRAGESSHVQQLPSGRWVRIEERRTPDGGAIGVRVDVTELKRREQELEQQNARFDAALNNMSEGLCFFDGTQKLIVCNKRYVEMYGLDPARIQPGISLREIIDMRFEAGTCPAMSAEQYHAWRDTIAVNRESSTTVVELLNGKTYEIRHQPMPDGGWVATHADISERRRMEERIVHMAHHDALTDLPNRVLLQETLQRSLEQVPSGVGVAVLSLDLDGFKAVNDTLGHGVGDALLKAVAERLRACVRRDDLVARLGGDEFAIVQVAQDAPNEARAIAGRIIEVLRPPFIVHDQQVAIGTSIGIAVAPQDGSDIHQVLKNSDLALYGAKAEGRGGYRFFEPEMNARMQARRTLEMDLRQALENQQFELHYQPLLDVESHAVGSCEALLRWRHPERGCVSPAEFIPIAETTGLIVPLGDWVLRQACREAMNWPVNVNVAVNLSAVQFRSPNLVQTIIGALTDSGLPPVRLELEITESVLLSDTERSFDIMSQLRALGIRIALDDFGTGHSSLSYLRSFPFDKIKIDRRFVEDLSEDNPVATAILRTVTELGRTLGMRTTAEGVEMRAQMTLARLAGCTEIQGYLFSPPVVPAHLHRLFRRKIVEIAAA